MQVMDIHTKKPNQISPEPYCLASQVLPRGPAVTGAIWSAFDPIVRCMRNPMSFIGFRLEVGKQIELWDSNVHKDIQIAAPEKEALH